MLRRSDIVNMHARLTPKTKGLVGTEELATMRDNAILVITAHGPLIDGNALVEVLLDDEIGGAVVDVYHEELPFAYRDGQRRRYPCLAGATVETRTEILHTAAKNMMAVGTMNRWNLATSRALTEDQLPVTGPSTRVRAFRGTLVFPPYRLRSCLSTQAQ